MDKRRKRAIIACEEAGDMPNVLFTLRSGACFDAIIASIIKDDKIDFWIGFAIQLADPEACYLALCYFHRKLESRDTETLQLMDVIAKDPGWSCYALCYFHELLRGHTEFIERLTAQISTSPVWSFTTIDQSKRFLQEEEIDLTRLTESAKKYTEKKPSQ